MSASSSSAPDQAGARARFAAPFVLVTGGKGGVGKTTVAANLAIAMATSGARALLVDLDLALANLDVLLGLAPANSIEDALKGRCTLAECVMQGPGGVHVLPASNGTAQLARLDGSTRGRLLDGLAALSAGYDVVIGDSAAGIGPDVLGFACAARAVLVVTTPDPSAVTDAYGLLKAFEHSGAEQSLDLPTPELVLNFVSGAREAELTAARLAGVCSQFLPRSPRLAGWITRSPRVLDAARRRSPFALACAADGQPTPERECIERLARRVFLSCAIAPRPAFRAQASRNG